MDKEVQEQFISYVFEDVKANLDEWHSMGYYGHRGKETKRRFRDKIIGLRCQYAKDNGLKTVTSLCPKPSNLADKAMEFRCDYIKRESARLIEEYKPLAIAKVLNDEELIKKLNAALAEKLSEYVFYKGSADTLYTAYSELQDALEVYYKEVQPTLSNPARCMHPTFYDLANELLTSLFTVSLVLKTNNAEQIKEVA